MKRSSRRDVWAALLAPHATASRRDTRILIADPSATDRAALHHALRALGCRCIEERGDGIASLSALTTGHFDLLISAWELPGLSAPELITWARATPRHAGLKALIYEVATPELVLEAAASGVNGFLPRPLRLRSLEGALCTYVGREDDRVAQFTAPAPLPS